MTDSFASRQQGTSILLPEAKSDLETPDNASRLSTVQAVHTYQKGTLMMLMNIEIIILTRCSFKHCTNRRNF